MEGIIRGEMEVEAGGMQIARPQFLIAARSVASVKPVSSHSLPQDTVIDLDTTNYSWASLFS